mmetsp:Transcript_2675/g.3995  ORF Transcript_2675/g.3995 Transcript_2675/m.3995 type:complete len:95 (-) Transcript_2675:1964-2248(-)
MSVDSQTNKPHSSEHGSVEMDLVMRASHDHALFREDSSKQQGLPLNLINVGKMVEERGWHALHSLLELISRKRCSKRTTIFCTIVNGEAAGTLP